MQNPYLVVRPSSIEGRGAFALQRIPKGTRIIEYTGERITPARALKRYSSDECDGGGKEPHVYLFTVSSRTIIDGAVDGSDARFINHSCSPNCEAVIENRRIYIESTKTIKVGEELTFDYRLEGDSDMAEADRQRYACFCGSAKCRGTMMALPKLKRSRSARQYESKQSEAEPSENTPSESKRAA